jgi:putative transposase
LYNNRRPHQALSYRTPMAVWRNGAGAQALDMMDNARALPTCPQPQQQQQTDSLAVCYQEIGTVEFSN